MALASESFLQPLTIADLLQKKLGEAIVRAYPDYIEQAEIAPCAQEGFGHYQCNSALKLAKQLGQNPRAVAQAILDQCDDETRRICAQISIAGPGFINLTLHEDFLSAALQRQLHEPRLGALPASHHKRIVVEFSSPNVAKELHVGHLRSTIIGDCLARLFEFLGYDVLRLNHIGDWGTQFGMLITHLQTLPPDADLAFLMRSYREAKKRFDEDPLFKKESQLEVVRLQSGDSETLQKWKSICEISRRGFQELYDLLGIQLIERGESFYNPHLKDVIQELEQKGLVTISEGAKCIFMEGFSIPLMIQKADGGYNYDTTDMAAIRHRIFVEKADRIIVVVDSGQGLHMQMIFRAAELAGWLDPSKIRADHVGFGLVLGPDGKKFKTRSGETERLVDLLTEAVSKARALLVERGTPAEEIEHLARVLGLGSLKYADLSCHRTKDYSFSYERMLRFEGNTAVFLLYAYVRIMGIKRKVCAEMLPTDHIAVRHISEISLGLHLLRFAETIELMQRDLLPNRLTDYLYALAERFNAFFRDCRVEGSPEQNSRLLLCELTARVLKQGLQILGLETVERM